MWPSKTRALLIACALVFIPNLFTSRAVAATPVPILQHVQVHGRIAADTTVNTIGNAARQGMAPAPSRQIANGSGLSRAITSLPRLMQSQTGGGNCTSDGYCINSFAASASSAPLNSNVTLSVTLNKAINYNYYLYIYDEAGNVVTTCGSGATCSATVNSSTTVTHTYTAYLISGNTVSAQSNPVVVSWASGNASSANTCTTDGYCISSFVASASAAPANDYVTLTATLNKAINYRPHGG